MGSGSVPSFKKDLLPPSHAASQEIPREDQRDSSDFSQFMMLQTLTTVDPLATCRSIARTGQLGSGGNWVQYSTGALLGYGRS